MQKSKKGSHSDFFDENCMELNSVYSFEYTNYFLKSAKKYLKNKQDLLLFCEIISLFSKDGDLIEAKYKAHNLIGNYKGYREAHIKNNLLLIWKKQSYTISFVILGTHSDLFK